MNIIRQPRPRGQKPKEFNKSAVLYAVKHDLNDNYEKVYKAAKSKKIKCAIFDATDSLTTDYSYEDYDRVFQLKTYARLFDSSYNYMIYKDKYVFKFLDSVASKDTITIRYGLVQVSPKRIEK